MPDSLYFSSPEELQEFFRDGRPFFNERYVKKMAQLSLYWNRIPTEMWNLNSTTEQTGFRFGRGWYEEDQPWRTIDTQCGTNACDIKAEVVEMPGTESYSWQLLRREMVTDWFCITGLLFKLFPAEQIMQIEDTNIRISTHVHQEFARANAIGLAAHHWLAIANQDGVYCGESDPNGWYVEQFTQDGTSGYNLHYIRVNCNPLNLANIATLSLDMLDDILIRLQNEDDAYRLDLQEAAGRPLLDVILPDARTARRMWFQAKESNGYWDSAAGWDALRDLNLQIDRVIGNYAFSYDIDAPRFNVDWAFNATLGTYNSSDPTTWPRLIRVPRYLKTLYGQGAAYIYNQDHANADFAISMPWIESVITKWMMPSATGYGRVQQPAPDYAGAWEFFNPKESANPFQTNGRFQARHMAAIQVADPLMLHPMLHRLDKSRTYRSGVCSLNQYYAPSAPPDAFCVPNTIEIA